MGTDIVVSFLFINFILTQAFVSMEHGHLQILSL